MERSYYDLCLCCSFALMLCREFCLMRALNQTPSSLSRPFPMLWILAHHATSFDFRVGYMSFGSPCNNRVWVPEFMLTDVKSLYRFLLLACTGITPIILFLPGMEMEIAGLRCLNLTPCRQKKRENKNTPSTHVHSCESQRCLFPLFFFIAIFA